MAQARPETDYERSDVPPRLLVALAAGLATSIAALLVAIALAFPLALSQPEHGPTRPLPPQPRLQTAPSSDLARYRAIEKQRLAGVDRAMKEVAAQDWSGGR